MHESFEAPAAIETWAKKNNHELKYSRVYQGDILPQSTDDFDFLVIMGGPQSPATTKEECSYFDGQKEIALVKKTIDDGKLVIGVCLGAQIIGDALGAKFEHSPNREIGFFDIMLTDVGKRDPIFSSFPETFLVGHWHGDMPGLTNDSEVLATSIGCPRQIVRYTSKVYGFQCHMEFTPEAIKGMIQNSTKELEDNKSLPYVQNPEQLRKQNTIAINNLLFKFLDQFQKLI